MDMGLYTENSISISDNMGRRLENLIFLHLRRKYKHIFYYKDKGECDFITMEKNTVKEVKQVSSPKKGDIVISDCIYFLIFILVIFNKKYVSPFYHIKYSRPNFSIPSL